LCMETRRLRHACVWSPGAHGLPMHSVHTCASLVPCRPGAHAGVDLRLVCSGNHAGPAPRQPGSLRRALSRLMPAVLPAAPPLPAPHWVMRCALPPTPLAAHAGPVMPLDPDLFPPGHPEKNLPIVRRSAAGGGLTDCCCCSSAGAAVVPLHSLTRCCLPPPLSHITPPPSHIVRSPWPTSCAPATT
jgi:hypothetical protein